MGVIVGLFLLSQPTVATEGNVQQDEKEQSESNSESSGGEQQTISEAVTSSGTQLNLEFQSVFTTRSSARRRC